MRVSTDSPPVPQLRALARRGKGKVLREVRKRIAPGYGVKANHEVLNIALPADVIVYFPDAREKLYQIEQWLPILEELDRRHPVLIVMRNVYAARDLSTRTPLRTIFVRRFHDLMGLYDSADYKVAIYVNHGVQNFQSLSAGRMTHIHVNHGESDKLCNVSNQVKAYDKIFVAGDAAIARHRAALINHDLGKLVKVGRPQLDLSFDSPLPPSRRRTLLYAPTWEGENEANNYTSVDVYGPRIVEAMLSVPNSRIVYRPHPQVPTSKYAAIQEGHQEIARMIERANHMDPGAGHTMSLEGSVLALFDLADLLVTDVSSVGVDFLYRQADKPLFVTDRRGDRERLVAESPVTQTAEIVDASAIGRLTDTIVERLDNDLLRPERLRMRDYYFGGLEVGESTKRFIAAVEEAISERDRLIGQLPPYSRAMTVPAAADGASAAENDTDHNGEYSTADQQ